MELALLQAQLAFDQDEVPVGSVIIKDSKIIGKGYNKIESLKDLDVSYDQLNKILVLPQFYQNPRGYFL